jgi:hypothetical protein
LVKVAAQQSHLIHQTTTHLGHQRNILEHHLLTKSKKVASVTQNMNPLYA